MRVTSMCGYKRQDVQQAVLAEGHPITGNKQY
jgi:hypothetical protein